MSDTYTVDGDVRSSADVERQLAATSAFMVRMVQANEQARANLTTEGRDGLAMTLLSDAQAQYAGLAGEIKQRAARFAQHVAQQRDWIQRHPDVAKTFYGTWLDPRFN
jgi:hypothetical protein